MEKQNLQMNVQGFDNQEELISITREQPFSDIKSGNHYGMPVTPCAAINMIARFKKQNDVNDPLNPLRQAYWFEISKASVFRVLSQENCEYIRLYLAIPNINKVDASLCLEGTDANGKVLKKEVMLDIAEKMGDLTQSLGSVRLNEKAIYDTLNTLPPVTEEKVNRGIGITDEGKSLASFLAFWETKEKEHLVRQDMKSFMSEFYNYVESKF
ncbi:hypothetical protein [Mucilaginibacter aquaedulcis]|uniref:hypothetical protein n=1 Tax=Mucilaginibacter aquaedulcis TaxID=1187081 RepID=UPI0025B51791|nr:hypothetical protein [Mucilaginibacter aquaedulcis]MDN3548946.1 hypothetical protein [Mucilaginibacter aquaedulcis]